MKDDVNLVSSVSTDINTRAEKMWTRKKKREGYCCVEMERRTTMNCIS